MASSFLMFGDRHFPLLDRGNAGTFTSCSPNIIPLTVAEYAKNNGPGDKRGSHSMVSGFHFRTVL